MVTTAVASSLGTQTTILKSTVAPITRVTVPPTPLSIQETTQRAITLRADYTPVLVSRLVFKNFDIEQVFNAGIAEVSQVHPAACKVTDAC
jgi:hypothetical protein